MYTKVALIIEIIIGLAMGGLGGFALLLSSGPPHEPAQMVGGLFGMLMILLGIFLIIFGCKKAWLPSIVTLAIATALFTILGLGYPICFLGSAGAIICLILLILGRIKKGKISIPWRKILIITALIIAGVVGYYLYRNLQRPVSPPLTPLEIEEPVGPEISEYEIYKHKIYGYDMIFSETPILKVMVFDDHNGNGRKDADEKGLGSIHLDQYWNDEFFGGSMTPESGVVNFFEIPLYQKITISLPIRDGKYWGWRTAFKEGWPVTTIDKYEFTLTEVPKETKIIYFGLKKVEKLASPIGRFFGRIMEYEKNYNQKSRRTRHYRDNGFT